MKLISIFMELRAIIYKFKTNIFWNVICANICWQ